MTLRRTIDIHEENEKDYVKWKYGDNHLIYPSH